MATVQEMMDAAASTETAAEMSAGDTFKGTLSSKFDEDWIKIDMTAGCSTRSTFQAMKVTVGWRTPS